MHTPAFRPVHVPGAGLAWLSADGRLRPHVSGGEDEAQPGPDEFVLPEDLTADEVTDEVLASLETQATDLFDAIRAGDLNAEAVAHLSALADGVDAIRAEQTRRADLVAAATAEAEALEARIHPPAAEAETPEGAEGAAEGEQPEAEGETPEAEAETPPAEGAETPAEGAPAETPEPVLAAAPPARRQRVRVPLGAVAARAPEPPATDSAPLPITAAADLPGISAGARFPSVGRVAEAMHDRARTLRLNGPGSLVASIDTPLADPGLVIRSTDTAETMAETIDRARRPSALVAAGGWCAPSQVLYDLFSIEGTDGLVDLPTVNVERGGIEVPVSPSIADVFAETNGPWVWTETDDENALDPEGEDFATKPCFRIPCPTWDEVRLDAHGLCITHGNLSDRAYPELTTRFVDLTVAAHLHLLSGRLLTAMAAASDAVAGPAATGATASILNAVELQVLDYRSKFRMSDGAVLEAVFPEWVRGAIRADLAQRAGVDLLSVPNSRIDGWFSDRNVRAQFVADWQVLGDGAAATAYPATATFLLYAAGTFVRGNGGRIDLGVVRDSTLNAVNDHTAAFTEEFVLLAQPGHESRRVTVNVDVDGMTACCDLEPAEA